MIAGRRRWFSVLVIATFFVVLYQTCDIFTFTEESHPITFPQDDFVWRKLDRNYPLTPTAVIPKHVHGSLPPVQAKVSQESAKDREVRLGRQQTVKEAFQRSWKAYKEHAWLKDEVTPISGKSKDTFGGWGATLVDSLDTLWIMGLKEEFEEAVQAVHEHISFTTTSAQEINVFETTIRFLGGLISAYDLSKDERLLRKARDVGDMIFKAFDTPNHMPITRWKIHDAADGKKQTAGSNTLLAEIGSMTMEFTRLSIITGDPKYYDAVQHISDLLYKAQMKTKIPGLWPILVNAAEENFDAGSDYSFGAMADSTYEYLSKMVALLGNKDSIYSTMHTNSINAAHGHLFYRPMTPNKDDILFAGIAKPRDSKHTLETSGQHLTCFVGGMLALGGRLLSNQTQIDLGAKFARGCVWAYDSFSTGVMSETFQLAACPDLSPCEWEESRWHDAIRKANSLHEKSPVDEYIKEKRLPKGFTKLPDTRYILRPEAIESVLILHRVTGDSFWREKAWSMWQSIDKLTKTDLAYSAVWNVNIEAGKKADFADSMESFWLGETVKYFYLVFSEPGLISLDDWVFNTEAHPFRRLK